MREGMDVDKFRAGLRVLAVDDDSVSLKLIEKQLRHCNYDGECSFFLGYVPVFFHIPL